jgi:biotin carboxylase
LRRFGPVVDIADLSVRQAADAIRQHNPAGILTFADMQMPTASLLAQELSLVFDTPEVVERLIDKPAQRAALRAGGVVVPAWWVLSSGAHPEEVNRIVSEAVFPVVVKPQRGKASAHTYLAESPQALVSLLTNPENKIQRGDFIVEEFLPGDCQ